MHSKLRLHQIFSFQARSNEVDMPESSKQRGFLEGAVIPFTYYLNGGTTEAPTTAPGCSKIESPGVRDTCRGFFASRKRAGGWEARATLTEIWVALLKLPH
jgi:hypothetical protein